MNGRRLPSLRSREVIRALQNAGFSIVRTTGSHYRLVHDTDPSRQTTVPVHKGKDIREAHCVGSSNRLALQSKNSSIFCEVGGARLARQQPAVVPLPPRAYREGFTTKCGGSRNVHGHQVRCCALHGAGSAAVPQPGQARQARDHADQAADDPARPVARLLAGRGRAGAGDRQGSPPRLRLHQQGQPGGGGLQRHGDPRARQPRRHGGQARHGGQGRAVQALRRHRRHRHPGRHARPGSRHQLRALSGPELRRHQPGGHQGAGLLHHRGEAARSCSTSRSSTTTSTAPPSSPPRGC